MSDNIKRRTSEAEALRESLGGQSIGVNCVCTGIRGDWIEFCTS